MARNINAASPSPEILRYGRGLGEAASSYFASPVAGSCCIVSDDVITARRHDRHEE